MNNKKYTFIQSLKQDWPKMINDLKNDYHTWQDSGKDFQVVVQKYSKKRSSKSLRAYWVLISIIKDWMEEQGNYFNKEELSDYFKFQVRHSKRIGETYITKSIANDSDCTWQDMKKLIEYITQFGAENNIVSCQLKDKELQELQDYYNN